LIVPRTGNEASAVPSKKESETEYLSVALSATTTMRSGRMNEAASDAARRAPGRDGGLRLWLSILAMLAVAACGSSTSADRSRSPSAGTPGGSDRVLIHLVAYNPPSLEVASGSKVTWTQQDAGSHTVTSGTVDTDATGTSTTHPDGKFDSGELSTGAVFSQTFQAPGIYRYFCRIHPATMHGVIRVK
jgi:plastocyanin